jgi:hypothetical protein
MAAIKGAGDMKRIAIVVAIAAAAVGAPALVAADSGGDDSGAYDQAHNISSPLGPLYGPVQAGNDSSTSYGYLAR